MEENVERAHTLVRADEGAVGLAKLRHVLPRAIAKSRESVLDFMAWELGYIADEVQGRDGDLVRCSQLRRS